ncbi:MAG TPA: hypothetical protein VI299_03415, partial [Polyangiales bacterium]
QRKSASAEIAAATLDLIYGMDVSGLLGQVRVPTLVLHRKGDCSIGFEHGRELASSIANATLVPLEGDAHLPWLGDWQAVADAALAFLAPDAAPPEVRADEDRFVREGGVWSIAFGGRSSHLKHARGLADLAALLARPGEPISVAQLMGSTATSGADPILDERARAAFRERLRQLDHDIEEAERAANIGAVAAAHEERDALLGELRVATGLGGRRRRLGDSSERARKAVSARIREAIENIRGVLPELALHLDGAIRTGTHCVYEPDRAPVWRL